jgi:hypothetical protein
MRLRKGAHDRAIMLDFSQLETCKMTELARAASPWLTPSAAAQYIGFSRHSVDRAISLGVLPAKWLRGERLIAAEDARVFRAKLTELARDVGLTNGTR